MKKFLSILMLVTFTVTATLAQGPFFVSGKRAQFTAPKGITANSDYLFPTFKYVSTTYDDTVSVTVNQLETWIKHDSISATSYLFLVPASYLLPGAKVYVQAVHDGTNRTLYISQGSSGSTRLDTLTVSNPNYKREYVYDGIKFEPFKTGGTGATGATGPTGPTGP